MKKFFLFVSLFVIAFVLVGCTGGSSLKINSELINANVQETEELLAPRNKIIVSDLKDYTIINQSYLNQGILVVRDDENKTGVWSVMTGKLLFPLEEQASFYMFYVSYIGLYIERESFDGALTLYDINGNVSLNKNDYYTYNITGSREAIYDDNYNFLRYDYFEEVSYLTQDKFDNGITESTVKKFKINVETKTKEVVEAVEVEDVFNDPTNQYPLDAFNLKGYYFKIIEDHFYVYDKNDKFVSNFYFNESSTLSSFTADGHLIYQREYLLPSTSEDYDFAAGGDKYKLMSYSINILKGTEKALKLDYIVHYNNPFKDAKGNYKYTYAVIEKIENKMLSGKELIVILDNKGNIVATPGVFYIPDLVKLNDSYYYDSNNSYIVSSNLDPVVKLGSSHALLRELELFVVWKNGSYGAINYEGKVVIPFEYSSISNESYDGRVFAVHNDGTRYTFDKDGVRGTIYSGAQPLSLGLLFHSEYDDDDGVYKARIRDYNNSVKLGFDFDSPTSIIFYTISNIYGQYKYFKYVYDAKDYVVVIDTTYVKSE